MEQDFLSLPKQGAGPRKEAALAFLRPVSTKNVQGRGSLLFLPVGLSMIFFLNL